MKEPRVKDIIKAYNDLNLKGVYEYLTQTDMNIDPSTWAGSVKRLIEEKQFISATQLIELTAYKFKI